MSIEDQLVALEARIQACMISVAGATEQAEQAAARAEQAAMRAELSVLNAETAASTSLVAAASASESMTISSEAALEAAEIMEEIDEIVEEGIEDGDTTQSNDEGGGPPESTSGSSMDELDGERESSQGAGEPIIIKIETRNQREPTLFKPNRTSFRRGRKV